MAYVVYFSSPDIISNALIWPVEVFVYKVSSLIIPTEPPLGWATVVHEA